MSAFHVFPYSADRLDKCLAENSQIEVSALQKKLHRQYFVDYFAELNAKAIVVEHDYVDHDYLEDYAAYYVRCFSDYKKVTTRLHFFDIAFDEQALKETLTSKSPELSPEALQSSYLGFVVVKPLPNTIIGRTCLKTYPSDSGRREFPILRSYVANLFGISLKVESLAYQEQDTVVAACATSALWSCFQGTGKLFQHAIPSPVEITKAAASHIPDNVPLNSARALPNAGLTATQMAIAIKEVELEPYVIGTSNPYVLNSTLYAYLKCKIPSILGVQLKDVYQGQEDHWGGHAVAVTGFSLGNPHPIPFNTSGFLLRASRIDKIYAHDDQVGPFARMELKYQSGKFYLATSWTGRGDVQAIPTLLLLPLYHKIRVPLEPVHDAILFIDSVIEGARQHQYPQLPRPEWDIYLTTVSDFKSDAFESLKDMKNIDLEKVLTATLPRFLWRVTAWCGHERQLDLIFDATGIAQHNLLVCVVEPGVEVPTLIRALAPFAPAQAPAQARAVFSYFKQN